MITDDELKTIFASAPVSKTMVEVISLTASWFSQEYHLQNQIGDVITVTFENGQVVDAYPAPMNITDASSNEDLTYQKTLSIENVNDLIATELERFDPSIHEPPMMTSRMFIYYRDGTITGIKGSPIRLKVGKMDLNELGVQLSATAKETNTSATGERMTNARFPMQRGF